MAKKKYARLGSLCQKRDKTGYYIKVDNNSTVTITTKQGDNVTSITLDGGNYINVDKPEDKIKFFLEKGFITEEVAEERLEKIPEFVKFELSACE